MRGRNQHSESNSCMWFRHRHLPPVQVYAQRTGYSTTLVNNEESMQQFPILSIITFTPLAAALVLLFLGPQRRQAARVVALAAALIDLALSAWVYYQAYFHPSLEYQFVESY